MILRLIAEETELREVKSCARIHIARKRQSWYLNARFLSSLNHTIYHFGLAHIILASCSLSPCPVIHDLRMCANPKSAAIMLTVIQSGEGSILLDPHQIGNDVKLHDSEHAEALWPLQLSPQETHQVLGYLLSFLWVAENASKNRSVPSSPRRGLQPKNVSPSFPKHRHHFLARSPSLPNQQLPKEWPFSHLENRLPSGKGRGVSLDSRKETFLMNCGKNCSFKASWMQEEGAGLWPSLLPPQEQLKGTRYVKVLCKLHIPGTITCLCTCFCIFKTAASRRDDFSCDTSGNTDFPTTETRGVFLSDSSCVEIRPLQKRNSEAALMPAKMGYRCWQESKWISTSPQSEKRAFVSHGRHSQLSLWHWVNLELFSRQRQACQLPARDMWCLSSIEHVVMLGALSVLLFYSCTHLFSKYLIITPRAAYFV